MNQLQTFDPGHVPAFAKAGVSGLTQHLVGTAGVKRISIKGGVFRLIDAGKEIATVEERFLDMVIINGAPKIGRQYYPDPYAEDSTAVPTCWSADGDKPDASIAAPQHANCADCPQNVKGSGQGDTRACRFNQRLAVLLANDTEGDVLQLQLPAQSLFGAGEGDKRPLQAYARFLASQKIGVDMVVTRVNFDTSVSQPKLFFKALRWLTDQEFATAKEKSASDDAIKAITMSVFIGQDAAPALDGQPPKLSKTPVQAIAEQRTDPAGERGTAEATPTKRAAVKPALAPVPDAKQNSLAALVDKWGQADDEGEA